MECGCLLGDYMPKKERKNETHQKVLQFEERLEVKVPTADDDVKHIFGYCCIHLHKFICMYLVSIWLPKLAKIFYESEAPGQRDCQIPSDNNSM